MVYMKTYFIYMRKKNTTAFERLMFLMNIEYEHYTAGSDIYIIKIKSGIYEIYKTLKKLHISHYIVLYQGTRGSYMLYRYWRR